MGSLGERHFEILPDKRPAPQKTDWQETGTVLSLLFPREFALSAALTLGVEVYTPAAASSRLTTRSNHFRGDPA